MSTNVDSLSIAQLRCFLAVIEAGSFVGAAQRLAMTTSGVSRTMSRLEAAQGVSLLHRSTHSVSPTEAGEVLIGPARTALAEFAIAAATLRDLGTQSAVGRVRIGAPPAFIRHCLVPQLPAFHESHPKILLDLRASDALADLASTGLDLAIRSGPLDGLPGHVRVQWFSFPWVICAAPTYFDQRGVPQSPEDLRVHDLIGFRNSRTGVVDSWRLRDGRTIDAAQAWSLVIDDAETAFQAALAGLGLIWAPYWLVSEALRDGTVTEVLKDWRGIPSPFSLLRRDESILPKRTEIVKTFLRDHPAKREWSDLVVP
ncbi:LysR family transcriptional regulator [Acidimangrovimonas sediminis]|uniref:LysR family transcriptional regulator n=1 Tax=Acidimangrovimonas sediminis TaxID=2056283 RepID=UPI000C807B83|nr:LysR family transcriptional regulator [Acidimangrovimonas sediminis]